MPLTLAPEAEKSTSPRELPHFQSFFMGGFECAAHIRRDRRRLDVLAATRHDTRTAADYRLLAEAGMRTVRDGLRWHLIEASPGVYDWSSFLPMLRAAHDTGTEVLWDLCHWGVPDWVDIFSEDFPAHFERFATAAAREIAAERQRTAQTGTLYLCPINEISFWSWVGGDEEYFAPFARGRGSEMKRQLVRASVCAMRTIRTILPEVRFLQPEPLIHVAARTRHQSSMDAAAAHTAAQFEVWDMLAGRLHPELGGSEDLLDILGVNYYWNNQWLRDGERTPLGHPAHVPLHRALVDLHERYRRPILLTETGAEADAAVGWLGMISAEIRRAHTLGASLHGVCLYPVTDYPGWDDNRHVPTGLISMDRRYAQRSLREELAAELAVQLPSMPQLP